MIIMTIFNMSTSYFYKISFHYFEDYLMTKPTLGWGSLQGEDTKSHLIGKFASCFKNFMEGRFSLHLTHT
jgi:hypothetical protein